MKKKSNFIFAVMIFAAAFLCGCMNVECVMTETFPPTENVKKYDRIEDVPFEYHVIGVCQTEGNYTEFSYDDMMEKIIGRGMENGADAVVISGMRVVPTGRVVQTSPLQTSIDAASAATANTWEDIGRDFGGGYGSIRSKSFGTAPTYDRIIRAQLIRFKRDENGEFVRRSVEDMAKPQADAPVKRIKEIKKENKNAGAN